MRLHNLIKDKAGAHRSRKRVGRGHGSGMGKTSGRGHKGQKARAGGSIPIGFEGGNIPLHRRLPTRGFNNARFKVTYSIVNLGDLEKVEGDTVDKDSLVAAGLVRSNAKRIKILGDGEVGKALKVTVEKVSASARKKIEGAGGSVTETAPKKTAEEQKDSEEKAED